MLFLASDIPQIVKEASLFNLAHLRTQLGFRIKEGQFLGWEGTAAAKGRDPGTCTHVWNYEQTTPFLFGEIAQTMRDMEFGYATSNEGLMSFRMLLPLDSAQNWGRAAADGQMGVIMKFYREWQLSGDDAFLKKHWPMVKKSLEFCWIKGGWDANKDGVMKGAQHNTMDVEYFGPNPQMGFWYLGALKATERMAKYLGEKTFAETCGNLYAKGSKWMDANLFNGEYYEQIIQPPMVAENVAPGLMAGMGAQDLTSPDFQLGKGVLVDQLVGQVLAHILDLGYLANPENIKKSNDSIIKYNHRDDLSKHPNFMRSYALGNESALLMAAYPGERPKYPFPYTEVMTGFEYAAAVEMLYDGQYEIGLKTITDIRNRYDRKKRSPYNEAEFGNHYARSMIGKWDLAGHNQEQFNPELLSYNQGFDYSFFTPGSNDNHVNLLRNKEVVELNADMSTLTRRYTDEAIGFIEKNKDQPFSLNLAHTMPHVKLAVSDEFKGKSAGGLYGDVFEEIDYNVGRLLAALKAKSLDENTYVIFISDNGAWWIKGKDAGLAEPLRGAKTSAWDGGLRVPCIIRSPGKVPAGKTSDQVTATIDLLPTLAKIAGAKLPINRIIEGLDISDAIHGKSNKLDRPYFFYQHQELRAVRMGKWKLHLPNHPDSKSIVYTKWPEHIAPEDRVIFTKPILRLHYKEYF